MQRLLRLCAAALLAVCMLWPHYAQADAGSYAYVPYSCTSETSTKATAQWFSILPVVVPNWVVSIMFYFYQDCALVFSDIYEFRYSGSFKVMTGELADIYSYEDGGVKFYFWVFSDAIEV